LSATEAPNSKTESKAWNISQRTQRKAEDTEKAVPIEALECFGEFAVKGVFAVLVFVCQRGGFSVKL
jgi:hypothetical protein